MILSVGRRYNFHAWKLGTLVGCGLLFSSSVSPASGAKWSIADKSGDEIPGIVMRQLIVQMRFQLSGSPEIELRKLRFNSHLQTICGEYRVRTRGKTFEFKPLYYSESALVLVPDKLDREYRSKYREHWKECV